MGKAGCAGKFSTLNKKTLEQVLELGQRGVRALALARKEDGPMSPGWTMLGILTFVRAPTRERERKKREG